MTDASDPWRAWLESWQRLARASPWPTPAAATAAPTGPDPASFAAGYGAFAEALAKVAERAAQPGTETVEQTIARELEALRARFPSLPFGTAGFVPPSAASFESLLRAAPLGPFGPSQALLQDLAHALAKWQTAAVEQAQRLMRAAGEALTAYGDRLRAALARSEQPWSLRQAFDVWVDCGEDAYARLCADDDYPAIQARAINAAVAAIAAWRAVSEAQQRLLGLPSRSELDVLEARMRAAEKAVGSKAAGPARPGPRRRARAARAKRR